MIPFHHKTIKTGKDLRETIRAGAFAWPGGYPLFFITQDGAALSFKTVKDEIRNVLWDIRNNCSTGWKVVACDINYEDNDLFDSHTSEKIPSAYGEKSNKMLELLEYAAKRLFNALENRMDYEAKGKYDEDEYKTITKECNNALSCFRKVKAKFLL